MADNRFRNFGTVVYPESAPEDWKAILGELCIPCFISPLHDKDIDPGNQPKKPHHHVVLMFEGKKSPDQVKEIFDKFGGVGIEIIQSIRGYARYLCHLDNPEKAQYNPEDVIAYGGADYHFTIGLAIDRLKAVGEMMDFVDDNAITSLAALMKFSRNNRPDWFRVLCESSAYVMREYIKSNYWSLKNGEDTDMEDVDNE